MGGVISNKSLNRKFIAYLSIFNILQKTLEMISRSLGRCGGFDGSLELKNVTSALLEKMGTPIDQFQVKLRSEAIVTHPIDIV